MNESGCNQNTGTEVLAEEEDWRRNLHPLDLLRHHWETGAEDGSKEDNENCSHVQGKVIDSSIGIAAALGLFVGHGNNYEGDKNVAQEMSAVIPDLPAVSSPATMDEEKVRSEKEEKRKESDTRSLKE